MEGRGSENQFLAPLAQIRNLVYDYFSTQSVGTIFKPIQT